MGRRRHGGADERRVVRRLVVVVARRSRCSASSAVRSSAPQPEFVERIRYPLRYEAIVRGHAKNYDLDPALLAAVIYTESRFNAERALRGGSDRAHAAAARHGPRASPCARAGTRSSSATCYVPELNVRYGAWYLRNLLDRYGDERTALAAYHAGQGNVDRWRAAGRRDPVPRDAELRRRRSSTRRRSTPTRTRRSSACVSVARDG